MTGQDDGNDPYIAHHSPQPPELTTVSATVQPDCRTTVPHIGTAKAVISGCNRGENSRADCHTNLPDKRATNRRKQRPTGIWLRGTVWQFRMRVPRAVVATVGREFKTNQAARRQAKIAYQLRN
jgi:hypothetical protein